MTLKLVLDRYEEGFGVAIDGNGDRYVIPKGVLSGVAVNDIFNIEYDGESFSSPSVLIDETEKKKKEISERMRKLYNMSRHRRPPKL